MSAPRHIACLSGLIGLLILAGHARAQQIFDPSPAWYSGPSEFTGTVVVGDVDMDGDLDLVCGNSTRMTVYRNDGGALTTDPVWFAPAHGGGAALGDVDEDGDLDLVGAGGLYRNDHGAFTGVPTWSPDSSYATRSIVLADMDQDGDLDLVCGNVGQSNTLYRNDHGTFTSAPVWSSTSADQTYSVAVGDVDGDGDLDLVCGNFSGVNTLYRNDDGTLTRDPVWSARTFGLTESVALGDIDQDGDLDLVCGNLDASTMYRNDDGVFSPDPVWSSAPNHQNTSIALGDVDQDGDPDLVCGNSDQGFRPFHIDEYNTVYLNQGGVFDSGPSWVGEVNQCNAVALGDMDNDGDLDLVSGNQGSSTLYRNLSGVFASTPVWSAADAADDVALGDVDGDGDLDLVCGNYSAPNHLYLNEGGSLAQSPAWSAESARGTRSIALGDIDGDGSLDLVCGNYLVPDQFYRNEGGRFRLDAWSPSFTQFASLSVALGDLDRDGDLDLLFGTFQHPVLYRNDGGAPDTAPVWVSGPVNLTSGVALGDVDGDGDLDLACGNSFEFNPFGPPVAKSSTLYRNEDDGLTTEPVWLSVPRDNTFSVALGDVDGDGGLDLVCANAGQANTVYRNEAGVFSGNPIWTSVAREATEAVALGDVNRDGQLDLVFGNRDAGVEIYLNTGGTLSTIPDWTSDPGLHAMSLALGDIDRDGDLDLVTGTLDGTSLRLGRANPPFRADPAHPTGQLPFNSAFIRNVRVERPTPGSVRLFFTLFDVESDPVWITAHYQYEGDPTWYPVKFASKGEAVGPFSSSPSGTSSFPLGAAYSLEWNDNLLPVDRRNVIVRLEAISVPHRVSVVQHVATYQVPVGQVIPDRSEISNLTKAIEFRPVTVGDTTSAVIGFSSTGTRPLSVTGLITPTPQVGIKALVPFVLPAGHDTTLTIELAPVTADPILNPVIIETDDPVKNRVEIPVIADIKPLAVSHRLVTPENGVELGTAIAVILTPIDACRIERGVLHVRSAKVRDYPVDLKPSGPDFTAFIPGFLVTEGGIGYYVDLFNRPVQAVDPPGAPDSLYTIETPRPGELSLAPQPNSGTSFLAGRAINMFVYLQEGTIPESGTLHFRQAGRDSFCTVPLEPGFIVLPLGQPTPDALGVIPDTAVGARGIEYWAEFTTSTTTIRQPAYDGTELIRVTVPELREDARHPAGQYRMVSSPLDYGVDFPGSMETLLGDNPAFGPYDPLQWRCFRWTGAEYRELAGGAPAPEMAVRPARAFWIISRDENRFESRVSGLSLPEEQEAALRTPRKTDVVLAPGWNQIGSPYTFPVLWGDVTIAPEPDSVSKPWAWNPAGGRYEIASVLEPFAGYFVWNDLTSDATISIPAIEWSAAEKSVVADVADEAGWRIRVLPVTSSVEGAAALAGEQPGATDGMDAFDSLAPPMSPEGGVAVVFVDPPEGLSTRGRAPVRTYAADLRPPAAAGHRWRFDVMKNFETESSADRVSLRFPDLAAVPSGWKALLVDRELGRAVDLRERAEYAFNLGKHVSPDPNAARFELWIGTEAYVDSRDESPAPPLTRLLQNRPNPVRSGTVIRYELAEPGNAAVRIFDVRGRLVASFLNPNAAAGRYDVPWTRVDDAGRRAAPGVYFYRLEAPGTTATRKLLVID